MIIRYWLNRLILAMLYSHWPLLSTEEKREVNALKKDADAWKSLYDEAHRGKAR